MKDDNADRKKLVALQSVVEFAAEAKGTIGALVRHRVLKDLARYNHDKGVVDKDLSDLLRDVEAVENMEDNDQKLIDRKGFGMDLRNAKEALDYFLNDKDPNLSDEKKLNLTDKQKEEYKSAMESPAKFLKLMDDEKFREIADELSEGMFGHLDQGKVNALFSNVINASTDEELKDKLKRWGWDGLKKGGKWGGILALILAAIPIVAGGATISAVKAASGR